MPMVAVQTFDALRALDYLATRPDVDRGRIGVAGFGPGARPAWLAAVLDPRFRFAVLGIAGNVYGMANARLGLAASQGEEEPDMTVYEPLVTRCIAERIEPLPASDAPPLACGTPEKPNFSVLQYFQGRIAAQSGTLAKALSSPSDWSSRRPVCDPMAGGFVRA